MIDQVFYLFISASIAYLIEENRNLRKDLNKLENKLIELLAHLPKRKSDYYSDQDL